RTRARDRRCGVREPDRRRLEPPRRHDRPARGGGPMSPCLEDEMLLDLAEGRRPIDPASQAHLAACSECRRILAAVARGAGATLDEQGAAPGDEPAWDELGQGVTVASRYVLEAFLGAGGMSVVWRARRIDDGARVALKVARASSPEL